MSIFLNKDDLVYTYDNLTQKFNEINKLGQNLAAKTYENLVKNIEYLPLPKISFDFQPDKFVNNLYNSIFNKNESKPENNE